MAVLVVLAVIAGWVLFVSISPKTSCGTCSGWGGLTRGKRRKSCRACKGTGVRFRFGARLVNAAHAAAIRYIRARREGNR
jgi:DnaJ-class molecular chaperone